MQFELNLLENSYDYLNESLEYYKRIGYDETHNPEIDSIDEKKKWKTTFLLLVQAVELLIKEKLHRVNSILIYEDIDSKNIDKSKLITYSKSLDRLLNLYPRILQEKDKQFLLQCGNVRNECIHGKVILNSIEIKKKYCKLFEYYDKLHSKFFNKKYFNNMFKYEIIQIKEYAKGFDVYRGTEFLLKDLKQFKKEIEIAQLNCCVKNSREKYNRIRFGSEEEFLKHKFSDGRYTDYSIYKLNYCGDCLAAQNEVHGECCDLEICPKCGMQLITCGCFETICKN